MTLPKVRGWLIDFSTARSIFESGNNQKIAHCVELCQKGSLFICHCEEALFREDGHLKDTFLDDQNCICEPDDDVYERCGTVSANPLTAKCVKGDDSPIYLTAAAMAKNYGVISDRRSHFFTTTFGLCSAYGVPVLSADQYFASV